MKNSESIVGEMKRRNVCSGRSSDLLHFAECLKAHSLYASIQAHQFCLNCIQKNCPMKTVLIEGALILADDELDNETADNFRMDHRPIFDYPKKIILNVALKFELFSFVV